MLTVKTKRKKLQFAKRKVEFLSHTRILKDKYRVLDIPNSFCLTTVIRFIFRCNNKFSISFAKIKEC